VRSDWRLGRSCRAGRRGVSFARPDVRCRLSGKNGGAAQSRSQPHHADVRACGKATTNLQGEVLQEQGVHGALETHMQLTDLAFSKRKDTDIGVPQSFVDGGDVFLIATETI
jgi:hypothetical protein